MRKRTVPAWVCTGLLLVACWIPGRWLHEEETGLDLGITHSDKVVHGLLFLGFGFFWRRALRVRGRTGWILAVGLMLAVVTELGQATTFVGRDADPLDALADVAGLLAGLGAARLLERRVAVPEPETVSC